MYHINNKTPQKANIDTIETVSSYNSINTINSINSINSVSSIDEVIENYLSIENTMSHISIKDGKSKSYGHSNRSVHSTKNNRLMTNNLKIKNLIDDYNNLIESRSKTQNNDLAYIYARTSTKQQEGMVSIDVQCVELLKLCYEHGFRIEGIYIDDGKSAKTNKKLNSLSLLKKNTITGSHVFIYDVSRLSRNSREGIDMLDALSKKEVSIYFKTEGISYDGSYNKNIIRKALSDSQYLSESITEKVNNAIKIKRQLGHHVGGIPYGYTRRNNVLVIDKNEFDSMKYIEKVYNRFNLNCLTPHKKATNILTNVNKKFPNGFRGKPFTMKHVSLCVNRLKEMNEKNVAHL